MSAERLFFDVYELAPGSGSSIGIYNYAKHLFQALVSVPRPGLTVVIVCNQLAVSDFKVSSLAVQVEYCVISPKRPGILDRLLWTYGGASMRARRSRASLYFSPRGFLPYGMATIGGVARAVVTLHDLIPLWYRDHFPRYFGRFHQWFICTGLMRAARLSDVVLTISDASAADIAARTFTTARVKRIYNGVPRIDVRSPESPRDYLLAMTSSLPHKNSGCILAAYEAYRKMSARPMEMIVVGLRGQQSAGVRAVSGVTDASLRELYAGARCFVFMSLTEGFGFPPLEAMQAGTPTICSDIPVLREITQGEAIYIDPRRSDLLADAMLTVDGMQLTASDEARLKEVARSYSWQLCADEFFEAIRPSRETGSSP